MKKKQEFWSQIASKYPISITIVLISVAAIILAANYYLGGSMNTFRYIGF